MRGKRLVNALTGVHSSVLLVADLCQMINYLLSWTMDMPSH